MKGGGPTTDENTYQNFKTPETSPTSLTGFAALVAEKRGNRMGGRGGLVGWNQLAKKEEDRTRSVWIIVKRRLSVSHGFASGSHKGKGEKNGAGPSLWEKTNHEGILMVEEEKTKSRI